MFHFANSALTEGNVVDNMLANPYVGFASKAAEVVRRNADGRPTVEPAFLVRLSRRVPVGSAARPHRRRRVEGPHGRRIARASGLEGARIREQPLCRRESHAALRPLRIGALRRRTVVRARATASTTGTRLGYERSFASETIRVQAGMIFHTDGTGLYTQQVVQVSVRLGKTLYDQRNHPQR